jgi:hypothetical protein
MIAIGGILAIAFVLYEWKWAPVPIMPCTICSFSLYGMANSLLTLASVRLFQAPHCPAMYGQSVMGGLVFYGNFFYSK